jgi:hypothetical protein
MPARNSDGFHHAGTKDTNGTMRIALFAICYLCAAACHRSPAAKVEEARATLRSWDATLDLLARERARGAVPERFAEQVRRAAEQERHKAESQLREAGAP